MTQQETIGVLMGLRGDLVSRGVTGLSIFGSRASGTPRSDSDLDVIVDYDPASRFSLLDLVAVGTLIETRLRIKADVMTRQGLHPVLRADIERSAVRVF